MAIKTCPVCEALIKGRTDKTFCSVKCKSIHQYERRKKGETFFFEVDRQLKINRRILRKYNASGYTTIEKSVLIDQGFNPNYFTHYWKNSKNDVYLFVYEFGFIKVKKSVKNKYLLVIWQDYMKKSAY